MERFIILKQDQLELIYIPSSYWKEKLSGFKITSGKNDLAQNTNFFLIWAQTGNSKDEIDKQVKLTFPSIPPEKLLTCQINLAFPSKASSFFEITTISGKIIPITPLARMLYLIKLVESPNERKIEYSNSIKSWIYLTKLLFEMLNKGQFVPKMENYDSNYHKSSWKVIPL